MKFIPLLFFCLFLQACTFAPFSNHYSARPIGKNKVSVNSGFESGDTALLFARGGYGVTENLDLGLLIERQLFADVFGGWGRYSLLNNPKGLNISIEGGAGASSLSSYAYAGGAIGYKLKWWEPYAILRYNAVHYDNDITLDLGFLGLHKLHNHGSFNYGSLTLGQTIWLQDSLGLNLNLNFYNRDLEDVLYGAGIVLTF